MDGVVLTGILGAGVACSEPEVMGVPCALVVVVVVVVVGSAGERTAAGAIA
jgi:hypothetical protein